ncbi:hypothetical protein [Burkholderia sp. Ac-20365]|uniref:hypothetical protein n=1 Tax=Burkholderia sp. Ac-20365 TaxID=2703897 RepID=UPI00197C3708|nr:hypothetical protein [Burkholderia sp. Ac-20365]MBN3762925.1 hypothetical protein [Burkholderia sp. Ac-20365]
MPSMSAVASACAAFIVFLAAGSAITAQAASAVDAAASEPKTLKERLGDKASDDQRVDNCKVPMAERGSKHRPDDCTHTRTDTN